MHGLVRLRGAEAPTMMSSLCKGWEVAMDLRFVRACRAAVPRV